MSSFYSWFLQVNLLLLPALAVAFLGRFLLPRLPGSFSWFLLRIHYLMIVAVLLLPIITRSRGFAPAHAAARIWSGPAMVSINPTNYAGASLTVQLPLGPEPDHFSLPWMQNLVLLAFLAGLLVLLVRLVQALLSHRHLLAQAWRVRHVGLVEIWASENQKVPLCFRRFRRKIVLLPQSLSGNNHAWQPSLRHELQHHRQGDTLWIYLLSSVKYLFFWNPAAHLLVGLIGELQEYACDQALLASGKVSPHAYGRCLLEVAAFAHNSCPVPQGAMGLTSSVSGKLLKRRMEMILSKRRPGGISALVFGLLGATVLLTSTFAANGLVRDQRIDREMAVALAESATLSSGFPIVVNDVVLEELNRYAGTPDGRAWMLASLTRMENYRPIVEKVLQQYHLPAELAVLPLVESGYQNLDANPKAPHAAGLWQIIPQTARNYNLRVDEELDQRLDPATATDAAARLLSALHLQFQDWNLALLAYNAGSHAVLKQIEGSGMRDAWDLLEEGTPGDKNYLHKVMAMIIIMKNPQILK